MGKVYGEEQEMCCGFSHRDIYRSIWVRHRRYTVEQDERRVVLVTSTSEFIAKCRVGGEETAVERSCERLLLVTAHEVKAA